MKLRTLFIALALTSCAQSDNDDENIDNTTKKGDAGATVSTAYFESVKSIGYPYHGEDGNRYAKGQSDISALQPIDIPLDTKSTWIAAATLGQNSIWAVVTETGDVNAFKVDGTGYEAIAISPAKLDTPVPFTLVVTDSGEAVLANVFDDASPYTAPVIVDKTQGSRAYVANNGDLVLLKDSNTKERLAIDVLNYSRVLIDDKQRLLVLTKPTLFYDHQVLGSAHPNAAAITLVQTTPEFKVLSTIEIAEPDVIEGNPLIWKDMNNDGSLEIVTTLSNVNTGARLVIYNEDGSIFAEGTPINTGYRWRHQVAVAPFREANVNSLASVYIPHLGPQVEIIKTDDGSMDSTREPVNYSSHLSISLNLDKSIAGDFDNDSKPELMLINRDTQKELAAVSYSENNVEIDWTLALADKMSSNIAAATLDDGQIALGVGQGNSLRIWHP